MNPEAKNRGLSLMALGLIVGCSQQPITFTCSGVIGTGLSEVEAGYKVIGQRTTSFAFNCPEKSAGAQCQVAIGEKHVVGLYSNDATGRANVANALSNPAFIFYPDNASLKFNLLSTDGDRSDNWFSGTCRRS